MRSVWFFKRSLVLALGAAVLCVPLTQTRVGSQSLPNNARDRSPIALSHSFQAHATASDRGVLVEWRTSFAPDILGFNIYRVAGGQRTQLNPGLINGSALVMRQQAPPGAYAWYDAHGTLDSEYFVESLDLRGQTSLHDRIKPVWSARLPDRIQSALLERPGANTAAAGKQTESPETFGESSKEISAQSVSADTLTDQWTLIANQPALKIGVNADGWYRITQTELAAAGFATTADARNLRLFTGGNEIAMHVSRDSGPLVASDYVEFWGQGLDVATTDTQIYWLVNGAQAGKRIAISGEVSTNGSPAPSVITPRSITKLANQDPLTYWFLSEPPAFTPRGASISPGSAGGSGNQVGRRQTADGSEQKAVSSERGSSPTVREGAEQTADGREQKADSRRQTADGRRDLSVPPAFTPRGASISTGSAGGSRKQIGSKQEASRNSKFEIRNSKLRGAKSRLETRNSKLRRHRRRRSVARRRNHPTMTLAAAPNFISTVQRKDRGNSIIYFSAALNGDQENFFGTFLSELSTPSLVLTLRNIETTSAATAQVTVALQGVSLQNHQVNVFVNNLLAGAVSYTIQDAATQTFAIPVSWLVEGDNTVRLVPINSGHDSSVLDYVSISYPHSFRPDNDTLRFSVKSTLAARLDGFTTQNIRVLDVSDPLNVTAVHPIVETSGAGFALTIQPVGRTKGRRLIALPDVQLSHPVSLVLNTPSTLNAATNAADLVIISHKNFLTALDPLVAQRQSQGFVVSKIDVEDIYDEFSYGVHTPQAIKDFLARANTDWATHPRYVLLVGDASYDPRNYLGFGNFDFVPTKLVDTGLRGDQTALETASDDWLTDFDGDGIADISIGRLPVRTLTEANLVVGKIVNYSPSTPPQSALLVADAQGSYYFNFEAANDQIATLLPASLTKQKLYRANEPSDAQAHTDIVNSFNSGQVLVVYSGHGNTNIWGGSIFSTDDAMALTNGNKLPFVVVMDCLNGFFMVPQASGQSLAEALVKAPGGGAVASFASSGLTIPDGQHQMGQVMFGLLYGNPTTIPIGDASRQAKVATTDMDVRRTWILFGDPTMKIR